jgi:FkbM family methyltransferase
MSVGVVMTGCSCRACVAASDHPERMMHDWVARLPAFVEPAELAGCAAALAQRLPVAILAEILAIDVAAIETEREQLDVRRRAECEADLVKVDRVAADAFTNTALRMFVDQTSRAASGPRTSTFSHRPLALKINCGDHVLDLALPHSAGAVAGVYEIFIKENYALPADAARPTTIYDLGANLGFSALYLHTRFPDAVLVCVEPVAENVTYLVKNLEANRVEARVLPIAIGATAGQAQIDISDVVLMHSTTFGGQATAMKDQRSVEMLPLDAVIEGEGFGLKLDIEGAEFVFADNPEPLKHACWVLGEIHGGNFVEPRVYRKLEQFLRSHFTLETSEPRITDLIVAREFRALPRQTT